MNEKISVVFDLDGTLADTSGDLIAAANGCFRAAGHGDMLDPKTDMATALRGGRAMLQLGLQRVRDRHLDAKGTAFDLADEVIFTARVDEWYPKLLVEYEQNIDRFTTFYPGALDMVRQLRDAGHPVAICTNKPEGLARLLLEKLGVLNDFDALIGADTLPVRKPDPEPLYEAVRRAGGLPSHAVLIGDTKTDHDTARAAGAFCVLVDFGPGDEDVAALKPDAVLTEFGSLFEIIKGFAGREHQA